MTIRTLSREEEAELARSNKKVKDISHAEFNEGTGEDSPPRNNHLHGNMGNVSFKDKLIGEIPGAFAQAFDFSDQMEADSDSDIDDEESIKELRQGMVAIKLSKDTKRRIRKAWSKAVIVKLVGRSVSFSFMQSKLNHLWKPEGRMDCVDLSNGFFLIRFYSKEDLNSVLKRGPWFVGDHFLSLRPWEPFFKPSSANISLVAVWIRLHELPIELYEAEVLREIGESIGKVLRVDTHTATEARGKYARLCIQIDTNKPLINTILIGRFEQPVLYEGIQRLCFSCGRVGHLKEACPYTIHKVSGMANTVDTVEATPSGNEESCARHETNRTAPCSNLAGNTTSSARGVEEDSDMYGPWMVVTRKKSGHKGTKHLPTTEGTTKPLWHAMGTRAESSSSKSFLVQRDIQAQARSGMLNNMGKRAHGAPNARPNPNQITDPKSVCSPSAPGGSSPAVDKAPAHKKSSSSVRGKKVIARNNSSSFLPTSAVSLPTQTFTSKLSPLTTRVVPNSDHGIELPCGSTFKFMASTERMDDSGDRCVGDAGDTREAAQPEMEDCLDDCLAGTMVVPLDNHGTSAIHQGRSGIQPDSANRASFFNKRAEAGNLGTWKGSDEGGDGDVRMEAEEGSGVAAPLC
nr:uncharacterized protein CFP56_44105 [Quercus suber]